MPVSATPIASGWGEVAFVEHSAGEINLKQKPSRRCSWEDCFEVKAPFGGRPRKTTHGEGMSISLIVRGHEFPCQISIRLVQHDSVVVR
jgi:hypothetical protein